MRETYTITIALNFYDIFLSPSKININIFEELVPKNTLSKIQNGEMDLVVKCINEGDIGVWEIKYLEELVEKTNIPLDNFLLIHDQFILNTKLKNIYNQTHLYRKANETKFLKNKNKLNIPLNKNKSHKFHLPIRRLRHSRATLLEKLFLYDNNFIDNNLISFDLTILENTEDFKVFCEYLDTNFINYMLNKKQKFIDITHIEKIHGYGSEFPEVYINSYFTIVSETLFRANCNYITEKTFKPIAHGHPFIMYGRPYTLKYLKEIGFKTFDPYINESYDLIEDNEIRFEMIVNEIKRLNELSIIELDKMIEDVTDILIHNQNHLISFSKEEKISLF